ncbi:carbon-nitrogen hydrolase family protein [Thermogladius sp. 4427co]|uniref:carbon-nitrogen hydrolase family protein n=1 Tax=Thermogladius sp. 4427co TaxID=3450718 RepID=UPI003F796C2E
MIVEIVGDKDVSSKSYIAIAHTSVYEGNLRLNLETARKMVFYASENNVSSLILPYMQPYGPINHLNNYSQADVRKFYALSRDSSYMSTLVTISNHYGVKIILPSFIEKVSSKIYVSGALISWEIEEDIAVRRKLVLSDREKAIGLSAGSSFANISDPSLSFNFVIDEEIFYPEIMRYITENGSDFVVLSISQINPPKNYIELSKSLALIFGIWVVVPGSRFIMRDDTVYALPTIVINPRGDIVYKFYGLEEAFIVIPRDLLKSTPRNIGLNSKFFYRFYKQIYKRSLSHARTVR